MSSLRVPILFVSLSLLLVRNCFAQNAPTNIPQRDSPAVVLLQGTIHAMGGAVPADSTALGSVTIVAGSQTTSGTIRILTKGTDQTSEETQLPDETRTVAFSQGSAQETTGQGKEDYSLELALSSQSACFPLPILAAALANPDEAIQYVGSETVDEHSAIHLRLRNTFATNPFLQKFSSFTAFDLWVDSATGLPVKISRVLRAGEGASPRVPLEVTFSNYQKVGGVVYPFLIEESLNGTPWKTITITSVAFNTGLSESSFSVQ